jgi:hypothetical protein
MHSKGTRRKPEAPEISVAFLARIAHTFPHYCSRRGNDRISVICCPIKFFILQACVYFYLDVYHTEVGLVAQSVQRLATDWTVRGSNPGGGAICRTRPDRPWGPPSLL